MKLRIKRTTAQEIIDFIKEKDRSIEEITAFVINSGWNKTKYLQSRFRDVISWFYNPDTKKYEFSPKAESAVMSPVKVKEVIVED